MVQHNKSADKNVLTAKPSPPQTIHIRLPSRRRTVLEMPDFAAGAAGIAGGGRVPNCGTGGTAGAAGGGGVTGICGGGGSSGAVSFTVLQYAVGLFGMAGTAGGTINISMHT